MSEPVWTAVDDYVASVCLPPDPALDAALESSRAAGLPAISVSAPQGKLLHLLARMIGARKILEIGTLGGYSAIWLARALPEGGRLVTLEYEQKHAEVARQNISRAGLSDRVDIRVGRAIETLPTLDAEGAGPFDLVFIDADKTGYADYWPWALRLARPGAVIIADNVVRDGKVADANSSDQNVQGVRRYLARVGAEPRVTSTVLQTVGAKGYDGLSIAIVQ